MAFNMKRPIIKGTPLHKASVAKAKATSVVSQARTQGDAGLIAASNALGKSYKPQAIDFDLDKIDIDVPEKKELTEEEQSAKADRKAARKAKRDAKGDTWYRDTDKDGNVVTRTGKKLVDGVKTVVGGVAMIPIAIGKGLFKLGDDIVDELGNVVKDAKAKGVEGKERRKIANEKRVADNKLKKEEREFNTAEAVRIRAEEKEKKAAAKLEADKLKQAGLDKKQVEKALALERKNEEKLKKRLIKEEAEWRKKNKNKKVEIKIGKPVIEAFGDEQAQQYTKEQRDRLQTEGVWSESEKKMVLPEEIVDGEFVSKAEGTKLEPQELDYVDGKYVAKGSQDEKEVVEEKQTEGNNQTNNTVVEKTTTTPDRKPRPSDFEGSFKEKQAQYKIANEEWYQAQQAKKGKSPMETRDNRIYRNARADGPVRRNMIKGGYTPQ
jgi:hypothetical protein